jgi:choline dehydrogenase-like flavoprotein
VVASGAGGGIVAAQLARAGKRVLLVERGKWLSYAGSGRRDHLRNHRLSQYGINTGPAADGHPRVHVGMDGRARKVAPHEFDYHNNASCVGSGTFVYGGLAWRYHPDDFRMASKYGAPDGASLVDWPIGYDDLEPWYMMAEAEIGVAGETGGDRNAGRRSGPYPMPPVPRYASARVLKDGADKLGIATFTPPLLVNTVARDGRGACIECGSCVGFPCPADAKNGTQNTVIPKALASGNLTLVTETVATHIDADAAGTVTGVTIAWQTDGGAVETQEVFARVVVVAAGAIETARLLLLSPSARQPDGLGNDCGLVGRNLQGHFYPIAYGLFGTDVLAERGPGVTIATTDFVHDNPGIVGGALIADDFVMPPIVFRKTAWPPDRRRWGREAEAFMGDAYRHVTQLRAPVHEIPDATCRVTLDREVRDKWGLPVARLSGAVHAETMRTAHFMFDRSQQWLGAAGAREVWGKVPDRRLSAYQHQAGTCRMGTDPATSVTDAFGRVWGHDNLFVSDASLHPTNGAYNPVLTIMALAFRNADHILRTWP